MDDVLDYLIHFDYGLLFGLLIILVALIFFDQKGE